MGFVDRYPVVLSIAFGVLVAIAFVVGLLTPLGIALWVVGAGALAWRWGIAIQRGRANRAKP